METCLLAGDLAAAPQEDDQRVGTHEHRHRQQDQRDDAGRVPDALQKRCQHIFSLKINLRLENITCTITRCVWDGVQDGEEHTPARHLTI